MVKWGVGLYGFTYVRLAVGMLLQKGQERMPAIVGITNDIVLNELFKGLAPDERAILCSVQGNPSEADPRDWVGTPWGGGTCPLNHQRNNYVAISSFKEEDGRFKRRKAQFSRTWCIMIDDIGTKLSKEALPKDLIPTLVVETSPGNCQVSYFLEQPEPDVAYVTDAIRQIIEKLTGCGADPGMSGVTRVLRLPEGVNGKPREGGPWQCKTWVWRPEIRTSWDELAAAFSLERRVRCYVEPNDGVTLERKRCYELVKYALKRLGRIKSPTGSGWFDITCPWIDQHTARSNTGAALAPPMQKNGYMGGFKCHHGHCESKNWGDLESWVADEVIKQGQRRRGPFYGENT